MKRWLPQPRISLALFVFWLVLNGTTHPSHLLLALVLAIVIPLWTARLTISQSYPKQILTAIVLSVIVLFDIVKSNITVAKQILGASSKLESAFVWVPLEIQDPYAKTALAAIITMTPGTLSADFSEDGKHLLVHALHVTDEAALVSEIKSRYELPLKEIFE